ncbi:hypothetical protein BS47DRAFT_1128973 [Hydnum rufescens UP504]|uniref:PPIase cyclophilin-type domain-containing protein n=1 Tax=Hydnum rufescens UP504 TaxID=1448309 RepID=A0A9P6DUT6_9AGAM|nr:hypothetical protein BS47DRAFT_1128973 [Hydnum rufescens UP504]
MTVEPQSRVRSAWHRKLVKMRQSCKTWSRLCRPPPVIRLRPGPGYLGMMISALDIAVYGIAQGRLEIELYPTAPDDLASHFVGLCEGSFGVSYIGTGFFGVIPGVALWGGDIQLNNGQGNYIGIPQVHLPYPPLRLAGPGYLAGTPHPNGFGSQFTLTLDESGADHLRYGTVFGRVRNLESAIFNALQAVGGHGGSGTRSLPERLIQIIGCGVP